MRCLESIKNELRTLVAFQALSELRSRIGQRNAGAAVPGSRLWRSVEERIERLIGEEKLVVESIEWLLGLEKRFESSSDELLKIINELEAGQVDEDMLGARIGSIGSSLRRLAADTIGRSVGAHKVPLDLDPREISKAAEAIDRVGEGLSGMECGEVVTALDGQLDRVLEMVEAVSAAVSRLEASKARSEVQSANYNAITVDPESMIEAARELEPVSETESVRLTRRAS